ncbi:MAG TPA: Wzz/FepE/Etk N-terminal domain-containing protein [Bryobacteraceae bacterium]|nr:Wzz/FepE/Etk N-terminal domain-containing protein [Bryobacteraceae bacterium]
MQPSSTDSYQSTVRRPLDVEDYIDIIRRHKAWILGPAFGALVIAVVVAFLWPDTFVSTAVIRVVPPQVPESLVPTNVNMEMSQRINAMAQTILSRGNLTNIINTYNLYPRERQRKPMEDVVEDMRKDVRIGNVVNMTQGKSGISAFQISFAYDNRIVAQKVAADLVSRFMSENTRDRTNQSLLATQFLKDQLETAKKELDAIEDKMTKFRTTYAGRLPDQVQSNQMQLNTLEQRISNLNANISRVSQEKLLLESELRTLKNQQASLTPPPDSVALQVKNDRLVQIERDIQNLEAQLAVLREHYKDTYPDVQRVLSMLAVAKKTRESIVKEEEARKAEPAAPTPKRYDPIFARESSNLQANMDRIHAQLRSKELQAEDYMKELKQAEGAIRLFQGRIESAPIGEQQYAEVIRDHAIAKMKYEDLNRKMSQSQISSELEKRQQGETLEVLDPASLPQTPTEPKRPVIVAVGVGMGIVLGLFFAGAREAKDSSLKNLKDVRAYTQLTILGSIPLLENDLVVRRRKRLAWLAWSTACLVGIAIMTGSVFYYYTTKV